MKSHAFAAISVNEKVLRLYELVSSRNRDWDYVLIEGGRNEYCVLEYSEAYTILLKLGERLGRGILELALAAFPEFADRSTGIQEGETDLSLRERAFAAPGRRLVLVKNGKPRAVYCEMTRSALGEGLLTSLCGQRFNLFEQGAVEPNYMLECDRCSASFSFYKAEIEGGAITYRCPVCRQALAV